MINNFQNGFHLIYLSDLEKLKKIISFLEVGFKWKTERSIKLFEYLTKQNYEFPLAAVHLEKGEIVIGILLFPQGYNKIEKKHIINLSAWYANENYRGINTLLFAKSLTSSLDKFIITNYTANSTVCKILKSYNFIDMNVNKKSISLTKKLPFIKSTIASKIFTFKKNLSNPKNIVGKESNFEQVDWLYRLDQIRKPFIKYSILSLYSHKSASKINIYWLLKMVILHKIVSVNLFFMDDTERSSDVWLIKNAQSVSLIPPTGSELVI